MQKVLQESFVLRKNSFQSLANFNVKNENVCVVAPLKDNINYCCYTSVKKFAICDI